MDFTNSLHNPPKDVKLRIVDCNRPNEAGTYPLYDAKKLPICLTGPEPIPVREGSSYRLELISPVMLDGFWVEICVNGCEPISSDLLVWRLAKGNKGEDAHLGYCAEIIFKEDGNTRPLFFLTYGFVRVQVVFYSEESEFCFSTKDIVTIGNEPYQNELIEQMLNDLLNSPKTDVLDWMLTNENGREKRYSSIEAAVKNGPNVSLLAYLQRVEEVLSFFRSHRDFFRYHGYTKVISAKRRLSSRAVRQVTRTELSWISKNLEVLSKTSAKTSIEHFGDHYFPQYLESRKVEKSFDRYENKVLLGFLDEVIGSTRKVRGGLDCLWGNAKESLKTIDEVIQTAGCKQSESCASIQLIRTYCNREKKMLERITGLINELEKERRLYSEFFSNALPCMERPLRRTKVFQEIEAYSVSFALMEKWFLGGDYALGRESFALQIYRLDELYEYYVLYCLLCWLYDKGFREDRAFDFPISHVEYSSGSSNAGRFNIANLYILAKGDMRIRLFYEPCISGGVEDECNIPLHRLSTPSSFSRKKRRLKPCKWTPDFLLEVLDSSGEKRFYVFDAKFRKPSDVYSGFPDDCEFLKCLFRYKSDIAGRSPNDRVSSVWLLCGRYDDYYFKQMEQSQWALKMGQLGSGIGTVTPFCNCLEELLSQLVLEKSSFTDSGEAAFGSVAASDSDNSSAHQGSTPEAQIIAYVSDVYRVFYDKSKLYSAEWSQKKLGINHPLLRRIAPRGRESRRYRYAEIDGIGVYVYIDMMPQSKAKLIRLAREVRGM